MNPADHWINSLELLPHPEGGFFAETYRSAEGVLREALPERFHGARSFSTAIYFLLRSADFSRFHRLKADEVWHFYAGSPLTIRILHPDGRGEEKRLGLESDCVPQLVVPHGVWFGAFVPQPDTYCLAGCTLSPGFDFDDFELASREYLLRNFPHHSAWIDPLCP